MTGKRLEDAVAAILGPGNIATSVTIRVQTPDRVIEHAWGVRHDGRPASLDDVAPVYCATKPLMTLAVLRLAEQGRLDLDAGIGAVLGWLGEHWFATLTPRDLLSHTRSIQGFPLVFALMKAPPKRARNLMELCREPSEERAYCDFASWFLLAHLVEAVTGQDHRDHVLEAITTAYGIDEREMNLGIAPELFGGWRDDIALNLYQRGESGLFPLAAEGARIWACEWNPPMASYASVRGLTDFYRALLDDLAGAGRAVGRELLAEATAPGERYDDPRLKRPASFGIGFMTNMQLHLASTAISPLSFGHSGVGAGATGFADPVHELTGAIVINRIFDEDPTLFDLRGELVTAIYAELGLPTGGAAT